ncbi:VOC family protein [Amycolatopsis sp. 195334CR]|uniref:VOC family protein n=1 Tax=Amycolatopsis sp. 195334CR TaxID=2814588 RepID=UPI001A8DE695|nr:VOC family protein [Amycolatopsis sp. 195334CR]MBN6033805.1 VOC family protein [Amycolatopsis sp. 195334CR]
MKAQLMSIMVNDQERAERFYTEKLGFQVKHNIDVGGARWLTVVHPDEPDGFEILLEPAGYEFARTYQAELYQANMPFTMLFSEDIHKEYARLVEAGVEFRGEPAATMGGISAIFDDTCGNLLMLMQVVEPG